MASKENDCKYKFETDKNSHVIIEASAGTGKTYTIEQIIPQLIEGGIPIEKIAVLTFTEKAAAELQDRIRNGLSKRAEILDLDPDKKIRLQEALEFLPNANIGTIHHFCRYLVKKYSLKLGLSAKFGEIKNAPEEIETYFKKFWGKIEKDDSEKLIQLLQKVEFTKFRETLIQITEKSGGKKVKLLEKVNSDSGEKDFLKLKSLLDNCDLSPEKPAYIAKLRSFQNQEFSNASEKLGALKNTFLTAELQPNQNIKKFILSSNALSEKEFIALLEKLRVEWEGEVAEDILTPIFEYTNQLIEEYEKYLISQDKITLDGLILKARDLVADREIKKQIQKDVQYIILDECQDTNPIQIDLVTRLFEGLEKGIIFVGDPKQSIYRFRNADLISYAMAVDSLNPKKELILDTSYRSSKRLIDAFNIIFPQFDSLLNIYKPVKANRTSGDIADKVSPPLILLGLDSDLQPKTKDDLGNAHTADTLRKNSIEDIVNVIQTMTDNERYLIEDKSIDGYRNIKFSDIAVLANSNMSLNSLLREFSRRSISANIYKSQTFYSHKIVQAISHLLHAVENPNDSASLYKTLASDLFLIPERILYQLSEAGELSYLFDSGIPEVNRIFDSLREAHKNRYVKDAAYTLLEILKENRILEVLSMGFEGKRNLANIYHLSEILSYNQFTENLSFGEIVRKLKKDVEDSVEQEIKLDNDKHDDSFNSVQLMTMHASKGLEFPVCILFDLAASPRPDTTSLFIKDSFLRGDFLEIELKLKLSNKDEIATPGFKKEFDLNYAELIKEKDRLLYVGFTRAKDYLVLPLYNLEKPKKNSLRSLIDNAFQIENIKNLISQNLAENFTGRKVIKQAVIKTEKDKQTTIPKVNQEIKLFSITAKDIYNKSGIKIQSYSSIARHFKEEEPEEELVKEKVVIEKNAASESEDNSPIALSSEKKGTTFGLLCHAVIENFNLKYLFDAKRMEEEVKKLVKEYYPSTGLNEATDYSSKDAVDLCFATLNKSYAMNEEKTKFARIKDWKYLVREKSFFYKLKSNKMDYLIGIGDGMFYWDDKYYLLDWKTNLIKPKENETVEEATQRKVKESYYYQYMIYSMNLLENITYKKEDKKKFWETKFGGMLFIFMRVIEDNQGSVLMKPSYEEILNFKKGLEN